MAMRVIYTFYCMYHIFIICVDAFDACKTPNNLDGNCIPLDQCPSLQRIVSSNQHQTLLSQSVCGNEGIKPYVCCPKKFTELDLPPTGRCGTQSKNRIFGGRETSLEDFPWMALLRYRKPNKTKGEYFCGGVLIHEYYVLTAAHCKKSRISNNYVLDTVRLGEHDLRSKIDCIEGNCALPVSDIPIAEIILHSNYRKRQNDIALIRLSQPAPYTDFIRPICLPLASHLQNKVFDDFQLTVAGFGKTTNNIGSESKVKLKVDISGINMERCQNIYRPHGYTLNTTQLCAGGFDGRANCFGDSGGPLIAEDTSNRLNTYSYLVGIVSVGLSSCGINGYPGIYTRVDQYIDWILDHMEHIV